VTNVVVAWGLAAWLPHNGVTREYYNLKDFEAPADADWATMFIGVDEHRRSGMCRRFWGRWISSKSVGWDAVIPATFTLDNQLAMRTLTSPAINAGERSRLLWGTPPPLDLKLPLEGMHDARGWPMLTCWCEMYFQFNTSGTSSQLQSPGGILITNAPSIRSDLSDVRVLPFRPLWKGVLVNSLTYGVCWFFGVGGTRAIRQSLRRRRGACFNCAYELAGLPGHACCPECGAARVGPQSRGIAIPRL